jgi:hypothetical protein
MNKNLITEKDLRDQIRSKLAWRETKKDLKIMHRLNRNLFIFFGLCVFATIMILPLFNFKTHPILTFTICCFIGLLIIFLISFMTFIIYREGKLLKKYEPLVSEEEISEKYAEKLQELRSNCIDRITKTDKELRDLNRELNYYKNLPNS